METEQQVLWRPNPGPQTKFLASTAFEALYGGAAGGGKSDALLMGPLRFAHLPGYRALLLRRTYPELLRSLIPKSFLRYLPIGGKPVMSSSPHWTFPSGAIIEFGHLQHEHDVHKYQSAEYQYIGFDELTSFTEQQYVYMQSRLRTTGDIPCYVRSGTNPGGVGHEWVMKRFAPWLDPESEMRASPGERLWYVNTPDGPKWCDKGTPGAMSRVFLPARISDNPHLNPEYENVLGGMDRVTRAQLLDGNWLIKPAAGMYFQRSWFRFVDIPPVSRRRVRRWDLASTEGAGDWTVGALMSELPDEWCLENVVRGRWRPKTVEETVLRTAELDGRSVRIVLPQDPGQAGVAQRDAYAKLLAGYDVRFERETGDKVTRAQPFSAQCEAKKVLIVRGPWNDATMQVLEAFPEEGQPDDDVDAISGAFNALVNQPATFGEVKFQSPKRAF
jgi:predicted phage terminase large subunit-like protein